MGDATDSGQRSSEAIAARATREWGGETDPHERPTRRDLPRLQAHATSSENAIEALRATADEAVTTQRKDSSASSKKK